MGTSYTMTSGVGFLIPEEVIEKYADSFYDEEGDGGYFDFEEVVWPQLTNTDGLSFGYAGCFDWDYQGIYLSVKRLDHSNWDFWVSASDQAEIHDINTTEITQLYDVARQLGFEPEIVSFTALSVG